MPRQHIPNRRLRLGVNVDHIATLRNARGGAAPCPIRGALAAQAGGADGITAHLREDRRHIRDTDIERLRAEVALPLNLEMAMTEEMRQFALRIRPHAICLVPEKREELTTEGGLDVVRYCHQLTPYITPFKQAGIRVSLFIAPQADQINAAKTAGADVVELHTGDYANAKDAAPHLAALRSGSAHAAALGLEVHAGHGLTYENTPDIAAIPEIRELNIGHFLIAQSVFTGITQAVAHMRAVMDNAA